MRTFANNYDAVFRSYFQVIGAPPWTKRALHFVESRGRGYSQLKNDSVVLSLITIPFANIRGFAYVELSATS
jgi:hypothetical protein